MTKMDRNLIELIDQDPQRAIKIAQKRLSRANDELSTEVSELCGVLIDAGARVGDRSAINAGVENLKRMAGRAPDNGLVLYSLGNGHIALSDLQEFDYPSWYLHTLDERCQARQLFSKAAKCDASRWIRSAATTNLGNSLLKAHRYVEAYDAYCDAVAIDPKNAIAQTGAARVILEFLKSGIGDPEALNRQLASHIALAKENDIHIESYAGPDAAKQLSELLSHEVESGPRIELDELDPYKKFVAKNRLALSPTIDNFSMSGDRWDSLLIESVSGPLGTGAELPPIFGMFNILKSDYAAARYILYCGIKGNLPESAIYADTLDYADYGINLSALSLSHRSCIDLLDKVAVAISTYLGISDDPRRISFVNRWYKPREKSSSPDWQSEISEEIAKGNIGLIALSELAKDLGVRGFLEESRLLRHSASHRFVILHDLGPDEYSRVGAVDHFGVEAYKRMLLKSFQFVRAALLYVVQAIRIRELRLDQQPGVKGQFLVPDHDWVRGKRD